jgi:hypothetical protein
METLKHPSQYLKAIVAAVISFVAPVVTYLQLDVLNTVGNAPQGIWGGAILAALIAFGGVFGISNAPSNG